MLSHGLEEAIQQGKAVAGTFTFGGSGVATIPVPKGQVLIIHHFDYFHFLDIPEDSVAGAAATSVADLAVAPDTGFTVEWNRNQFGGDVNTPPVVFDTADVPTTTQNFQSALTSIYPGYLVTSLSFVLGVGWSFTIQAPYTTGASINGVIPVVTVVGAGGIIGVTPFAGGINGLVTPQQIIDSSKHILEFRSKKSRNHFAIQEDFTMFFAEVFTGDPTTNFVNARGCYQKDTYLVHTENVQIDIWRVPPVSEWTICFAQLPQKSQENSQPVGYGQFPTGVDAVREILFSGAVGVNEQYLPLTEKRDDQPLISGPTGYIGDQFRPNMNGSRGLISPNTVNSLRMNGRTYPLVNVDYVLADAQFTKFVKKSP